MPWWRPALRLFIERGYVAARGEDIAAEAGVSRATFYKYFSERDQILAELFTRLLGTEPAKALPGAAADVVARVRLLLRRTAETMVEQPVLARSPETSWLGDSPRMRGVDQHGRGFSRHNGPRTPRPSAG
jgi:AcrR family transcriptional regulator